MKVDLRDSDVILQSSLKCAVLQRSERLGTLERSDRWPASTLLQ